MSRSQSVISCLILSLVFLSCAKDDADVYKGPKNRSEKYLEAFRIVEIPYFLENGGSNEIIKVPVEYRYDALKVVSFVDEHIPRDTQNNLSSTFVNRFVPILENDPEQKFLTILKSVPGILGVTCGKAGLEEKNYKNLSCEIKYFSTQIDKSEIASLIESFASKNEIDVEFMDMNALLIAMVTKDDSSTAKKSTLMILEPFSFHVPYGEKEVAGVQLIIVLGVFLLSGFVFGFWIGVREKKGEY